MAILSGGGTNPNASQQLTEQHRRRSKLNENTNHDFDLRNARNMCGMQTRNKLKFKAE